MKASRGRTQCPIDGWTEVDDLTAILTIELIEPDCPVLEISKSCGVIPPDAAIGGQVSYGVTIANAGNVTLTDIVVTDEREGTFDSPFPTELLPGESAERIFTSTITMLDALAGDVDNTVSVTATIADSPPLLLLFRAAQMEEETVTSTAVAECKLSLKSDPPPTPEPKPTGTPEKPVTELPDTGHGMEKSSSMSAVLLAMLATICAMIALERRSTVRRDVQ